MSHIPLLRDVSSYTIQQQSKNLKTVSVQTAPLPMNQLQMETGKQLLHGKIMQCKIPYSLSIVDDTETIDWNV
jgi:hypothetical protein